jgi:polyphosphate kinase
MSSFGPGHFLNRELSWLEFNHRVLAEAQDSSVPLLERVKFLAIFSSNLDEFYMKRVGLLRGNAQVEDEADPVARAGDVRQRLKRIRERVIAMQRQQAECFSEVLVPALAGHGIILALWEQLSTTQREEAGAYFDANVSPALTPLGVDPAQPFPFMSNLSTNLGFLVRRPETDEVMPVRVKAPTILPQWVALRAPDSAQRWFVSLHELIRHSGAKLFPGMEILGHTLFRVLRNAEVGLEEEEGETVFEAVTDALRERRFQPVVRVDFSIDPIPEIRRGLVERFKLTEDDVYELPGLLDYSGLFQIASLDLPNLRDPNWSPLPLARIPTDDVDIFSVIQAGDLLVHHPYESFDLSVEQFLWDVSRLAASLPDRQYLLNFCTDRYHFSVGFAAALVRRQINLLPPNETPDLIERLASQYPELGVYLLVLEVNASARRFYERLGGQNAGVATMETHGGAIVRSCRYTWSRPGQLYR